jgi:hypothetical protein
MDYLRQLQNATDFAVGLAARYTVSDMAIEQWVAELKDAGPSERDAVTAGALASILLDLAEAHAGCALPDCLTCERLRDGLALTVSALRLQVSTDLERRVYFDSEPVIGRAQVPPENRRGLA